MPTGAQYSDVFNYIMNTMPVDNVTSFSEGNLKIDPKYSGIINVMDRQSGGDDPRTSQVIDIDYKKLPNAGMTKYGLIGGGALPAQDPSTPLAPGTQSTLKDPKMVYYDPNYGWVTPASNRKVSTGEQINNYMPYIMMALGTAGVGALASIPAGVMGAAGAAAKYVGNTAEGPGDTFGRSALTGTAPVAPTPTMTPDAVRPTPTMTTQNVAPVRTAQFGQPGFVVPRKTASGIGLLSDPYTQQMLRMIRGGQ
jgi:hypothetical protein